MILSPQSLVNDVYIGEVLKNLHENDKTRLNALLDNFPKRDNKTKSRILFEISVTNNDDAFHALNRMITVQGLNSQDKDELLDIFLEKSLTDTQFVVPFIDHAESIHLQPAVPVFANILLSETDSYILQKTIAAIGQTGDPSCINVVADFIFYDHEELKRAAIDALEQIGGASVIERLVFASKTSKSDPYLVAVLERMVAESPSDGKDTIDSQTRQFASKKDLLNEMDKDSDIAQLLLMLNSDSPHNRHIAIDGLIEFGPMVIPAICEDIDLSDSDSLINGLDILGNISHETALPFILKVLNMNHQDSNVRFASYEALSRLPKAHLPVSLIDGITDSSEQVRLAAATVINKAPTDIMIAGLKSKIETSGRNSKRNLIIAAIIDSHSDQIFIRLMDSDAFVFQAMEYLVQAHSTTVSFFVGVLERRGTMSHARAIQNRIKDRDPVLGITVFCVDDSAICLKYYIRLFHAMGLAPETFETPDAAIEALKSKTPGLLISDLNMLSMNGLQLAETVRDSLKLNDLPIFIITTQKDFVSDFQSNQSHSNLINAALHKPPTPKDLKKILREFP
jgi:CheY-like chemotaxis protein